MKIENSDTATQPSVATPPALQHDSLAAFHDVSPSARICVTINGALQLNGMSVNLNAVTAELQRLKSVDGTVYYYREASGTQTHPVAGIVFDLVLDAQVTLMRISTSDFAEYYDLQGQSWPRDQNKRRERQHAGITKLINRLWLQGLALGFALVVRVVYKAHQPSVNQQLVHYQSLASVKDTAFVALVAAAAVFGIFGIVGLLVRKKLLKGL